jgi:hypothetical protein
MVMVVGCHPLIIVRRINVLYNIYEADMMDEDEDGEAIEPTQFSSAEMKVAKQQLEALLLEYDKYIQPMLAQMVDIGNKFHLEFTLPGPEINQFGEGTNFYPIGSCQYNQSENYDGWYSSTC